MYTYMLYTFTVLYSVVFDQVFLNSIDGKRIRLFQSDFEKQNAGFKKILFKSANLQFWICYWYSVIKFVQTYYSVELFCVKFTWGGFLPLFSIFVIEISRIFTKQVSLALNLLSRCALTTKHDVLSRYQAPCLSSKVSKSISKVLRACLVPTQLPLRTYLAPSQPFTKNAIYVLLTSSV